jgi:vacuolar-type H+-ATPase subunit H
MKDRHAGRRSGAEAGTGERVKEAAHQAQDKVADAAREIRDRGEDLVEEGKEKTREMADRASEAAVSRADQEKGRLTSGMRAVADALRRGSADLPEDQRTYGRLVEGVADRVEDASRYLSERNVDGLRRDATRWARDHTPMFLGGAFLLGALGARFLKSSPDAAQEDDFGRQDWSYGYGAGATRGEGRRELEGWDVGGASQDLGGARRTYPTEGSPDYSTEPGIRPRRETGGSGMDDLDEGGRHAPGI